MPAKTITAHKSSAFLERISDGLRVGAGEDQHCPVTPSWSGHRERSAIGFSIPASTWDDMGAVNLVELVLRSTGSGVHVGRGSSPKCEVRRITESFTPNNDSMDGGGSATTSGLVYPGPSTVGTNAATCTYSGSGGATNVTTAITALARAWMPSRLGGSGASCYGVMLIQGSSSNDTSEFYSAEASSSDRPFIRITYQSLTDTVPNSPSLVSPIGQLVNASTFAFTTAQVMSAYDIQVSTDKTFATVTHWNATNASAGIAGTGKSVSTAYTGTALKPTSPTYWWRARARNASGWGSWSAAASFTVDPAALPVDQYDAWARHILADLAAPRRHTVLGTLIPSGPEVAAIAGTDYAGRWYVQDANHGTPIERVIEVVGITLHADHGSGWSVDATTHDVGGPEAIPPARPYSERVLSGDYAPVPASHWRLGETAGTFADSTGAYPGSVSGTVTRGAGSLSPRDTDGALASAAAGGANYGSAAGEVSGTATWTAAAWVVWDGTGEMAILDKISGGGGTWAGWRAFVNGTTGKLQTFTGNLTGLPATVGATVLVVGRTYHVAYVWDVDAISVYLDGVLDGTGARIDPSPSAAKALITYIRGTLDELSLWYTPLSAEQIGKLYAPPIGG